MPVVSICGVGYCDRTAQSDPIKTALNRRIKDLLEKIKCLQIIFRHTLYRVLSVIQSISFNNVTKLYNQNTIHTFFKPFCKETGVHHCWGLGVDATKRCIYEYIINWHCSRLCNNICMRHTFAYLAKSGILNPRFSSFTAGFKLTTVIHCWWETAKI